jgi:hypothetical protein
MTPILLDKIGNNIHAGNDHGMGTALVTRDFKIFEGM